MSAKKGKANKDQVAKLFSFLGSPFVEEPGNKTLKSSEIDDLFELSFENRVALLMLNKCFDHGIELSVLAKKNHQKLLERRAQTDEILKKLTRLLDENYKDQWAFFKTVKPFASTPNDTDWFPFDTKKHAEMCDVLLANGFEFLENAPLQLTVIDQSGVGLANSDKRGGVWYIDCYRAPGADYFKYLDPKKMSRHLERTTDGVTGLPILGAEAELCAICFHNVFPEKTYSIESFYLICHYLLDLGKNNRIDDFLEAAKYNHVGKAVSVNLRLTALIHTKYFGFVPKVIEDLLAIFNDCDYEESNFQKQDDLLPYNFSGRSFWAVFFAKLKDPIAFRSLFVQFFHMLNPVFFAGVIKIIWQRSRKGGIYKQM
jgi:hypothetical protein